MMDGREGRGLVYRRPMPGDVLFEYYVVGAGR